MVALEEESSSKDHDLASQGASVAKKIQSITIPFLYTLLKYHW